ncbi:hypothetical protein FWD20_00440 [Candidatus Saccharibacteria bacterium]|nr:hypothetical protein [Candidatus Saccharibacteria bacterium]
MSKEGRSNKKDLVKKIAIGAVTFLITFIILTFIAEAIFKSDDAKAIAIILCSKVVLSLLIALVVSNVKLGGKK